MQTIPDASTSCFSKLPRFVSDGVYNYFTDLNPLPLASLRHSPTPRVADRVNDQAAAPLVEATSRPLHQPGSALGHLRDMRAAALWAEIPPELAEQRWSRDADDDVFILTALAAKASCLVTGNNDLLLVPAINGLRIMSPEQAMQAWTAA